LADCFKSEFLYRDNLLRYGSYQNTFKEWLMGLPSCIDIAFENYRIIEIAKEWGSIPENATEKQEDVVLENWFNLIAAKTFSLFHKHGIDYSL